MKQILMAGVGSAVMACFVVQIVKCDDSTLVIKQRLLYRTLTGGDRNPDIR
ncbi:hypothetical protein PC121_g24802 [Phytophthora cactorum]|nr:hypothetical protein PC121_g24802 [Phytophthora cactorum]